MYPSMDSPSHKVTSKAEGIKSDGAKKTYLQGTKMPLVLCSVIYLRAVSLLLPGY